MEATSLQVIIQGWLLKNILYAEAPPRSPNSYPFIHRFLKEKGNPFTYLLVGLFEMSWKALLIKYLTNSFLSIFWTLTHEILPFYISSLKKTPPFGYYSKFPLQFTDEERYRGIEVSCPRTKTTQKGPWRTSRQNLFQTCFTSQSSESSRTYTAITVHVFCARGIVFTWRASTLIFICTNKQITRRKINWFINYLKIKKGISSGISVSTESFFAYCGQNI